MGCPVLPFADLRRTEACSRGNDRPDGVVVCFHVSRNKVEPSRAVLTRDLFSKEFCRTALADEMVPVGPEVPLIIKPAALACRAERLARATARPHRPCIKPSGPAQGKGPDADSREEMALGVSSQVTGANVADISFIDIPRCDLIACDEVAQPLGRVGVDLVVVGAHASKLQLEVFDELLGLCGACGDGRSGIK